MKPFIIKAVNIGLLLAFLLTIGATPFMKIHFFKEMHEICGSIMAWLVLAHVFIYRKAVLSMFKRRPAVQMTPQQKEPS